MVWVLLAMVRGEMGGMRGQWLSGLTDQNDGDGRLAAQWSSSVMGSVAYRFRVVE